MRVRVGQGLACEGRRQASRLCRFQGPGQAAGQGPDEGQGSRCGARAGARAWGQGLG